MTRSLHEPMNGARAGRAARAGRIVGTLTAGLLLSALVACGGSGDGSGTGNPSGGTGAEAGPAISGLPSEATSSTGSMLAWMRGMVGARDDAASPIAIGTASLPIDDRGTPVPIR